MKNINDVCILVQARLGSQRVPGKMLRPFAGTTLVDILFKKLKTSKIINKNNIHFSVYEQELKDVANKHTINIFSRSEASAMSEGEPLSEIYEWYNKLPYKYVVLISACNPLLKIETIDSFLESFLNSKKEGGFAVFEKKTYYWDKKGKPISNWGGATIMNTKLVEPIYEAAHCLYASRMDIIKDGFWMDVNSPPQPELFIMDELETFDIDYEWQFNIGEKLYKEC
jgi:CMP-N-acetylneuraminic acid synthetase|tara:strand:- start:155 stop:832 length:678 start_codon:yes stop_codon:yes gene_type:complete